MARAGGKPAKLTVWDRALHLAAFSAQRLSTWSLGAKLAALTALTGANIFVGAAAYRYTTGDPWCGCAHGRAARVRAGSRVWRRPAPRAVHRLHSRKPARSGARRPPPRSRRAAARCPALPPRLSPHQPPPAHHHACLRRSRGLSLFTIYGVLLRAPGFTVRSAPNALGTLVLNIVLIYSL